MAKYSRCKFLDGRFSCLEGNTVSLHLFIILICYKFLNKKKKQPFWV